MFDNVTPVSDYEHSLKLRHFLQENQTLSRVLSTSGKKKGVLADTLFKMD
jgi:negative regulator of sigma E activity